MKKVFGSAKQRGGSQGRLAQRRSSEVVLQAANAPRVFDRLQDPFEGEGRRCAILANVAWRVGMQRVHWKEPLGCGWLRMAQDCAQGWVGDKVQQRTACINMKLQSNAMLLSSTR